MNSSHEDFDAFENILPNEEKATKRAKYWQDFMERYKDDDENNGMDMDEMLDFADEFDDNKFSDDESDEYSTRAIENAAKVEEPAMPEESLTYYFSEEFLQGLKKSYDEKIKKLGELNLPFWQVTTDNLRMLEHENEEVVKTKDSLTLTKNRTRATNVSRTNVALAPMFQNFLQSNSNPKRENGILELQTNSLSLNGMSFSGTGENSILSQLQQVLGNRKFIMKVQEREYNIEVDDLSTNNPQSESSLKAITSNAEPQKNKSKDDDGKNHQIQSNEGHQEVKICMETSSKEFKNESQFKGKSPNKKCKLLTETSEIISIDSSTDEELARKKVDKKSPMMSKNIAYHKSKKDISITSIDSSFAEELSYKTVVQNSPTLDNKYEKDNLNQTNRKLRRFETKVMEVEDSVHNSTSNQFNISKQTSSNDNQKICNGRIKNFTKIIRNPSISSDDSSSDEELVRKPVNRKPKNVGKNLEIRKSMKNHSITSTDSSFNEELSSKTGDNKPPILDKTKVCEDKDSFHNSTSKQIELNKKTSSNDNDKSSTDRRQLRSKKTYKNLKPEPSLPSNVVPFDDDIENSKLQQKPSDCSQFEEKLTRKPMNQKSQTVVKNLDQNNLNQRQQNSERYETKARKAEDSFRNSKTKQIVINKKTSSNGKQNISNDRSHVKDSRTTTKDFENSKSKQKPSKPSDDSDEKLFKKPVIKKPPTLSKIYEKNSLKQKQENRSRYETNVSKFEDSFNNLTSQQINSSKTTSSNEKKKMSNDKSKDHTLCKMNSFKKGKEDKRNHENNVEDHNKSKLSNQKTSDRTILTDKLNQTMVYVPEMDSE
ncbi:CLUMA_CG004819, isoform A [Clunio marinus]|uniref:CLUMA_CG004819, isoform A n=1 Tax=Clunio marinus TaxID=568069 RepID=A0A1J1HUT9_9DIPT|nr:CLUMA_CG004819, isoform A [Clunio marinus]